MRRWRLFPRSLRRLVLMAFLLVLPLLVLAWQAWENLSALSNQAADTSRNTFTDVQRSEAIARTALELERSYRQYCVLGDATLARLYQTQRALQSDPQFSRLKSARAGSSPDAACHPATADRFTMRQRQSCGCGFAGAVTLFRR